MDESRDYHTKQSKSEKDKYPMTSPICGNYNMIQMNISKKRKLTDEENRLMVARHGERGGGGRSGRIRSLGLAVANYHM